MGLFDRFKKKSGVPTAVAVQTGRGGLCAPVSGRVMAMQDVPDPLFAGGSMGPGCAVWPSNGVVYAPLSGKVVAAMGHALGIAGDDGTEVIVHIGIDTVEMGGTGFTGYVAVGDRVEAGQPCVGIDRAAIARAGHPDCVVVVVTNADDMGAVSVVAKPGNEVAAGAALLQVGQ